MEPNIFKEEFRKITKKKKNSWNYHWISLSNNRWCSLTEKVCWLTTNNRQWGTIENSTLRQHFSLQFLRCELSFSKLQYSYNACTAYAIHISELIPKVKYWQPMGRCQSWLKFSPKPSSQHLCVDMYDNWYGHYHNKLFPKHWMFRKTRDFLPLENIIITIFGKPFKILSSHFSWSLHFMWHI